VKKTFYAIGPQIRLTRPSTLSTRSNSLLHLDDRTGPLRSEFVVRWGVKTRDPTVNGEAQTEFVVSLTPSQWPPPRRALSLLGSRRKRTPWLAA
jgi:hypothetical protein